MLAVSTLVIGEETTRARARYDQTAESIRRTNARLEGIEGKLRQLTGSVVAVEEEVREQLRMVKPGESLILIRREGAPTRVDPVPPPQAPQDPEGASLTAARHRNADHGLPRTNTIRGCLRDAASATIPA